MNDKEKKIKEQRTIEATRKGMMGFGGKLGVIVRHMGQPITMHNEGGIYQDTRYLDDPWKLPEESDPWELNAGSPEEVQRQIPYMGSELEEPEGDGWREGREPHLNHVATTQIGWHFDGLSRGMHIEIKYDGDQKELVALYQGYLVYKEVAGELAAYSPNEEWESKIDSLYAVAKKREQQARKQEKQDKIEEAKAAKEYWWQRIQRKWGL